MRLIPNWFFAATARIKIGDLEAQNTALLEQVSDLKSELAKERADRQQEQQLYLEKTERMNKTLFFALNWIKTTHRVNEIPGMGSIRDLLQRR